MAASLHLTRVQETKCPRLVQRESAQNMLGFGILSNYAVPVPLEMNLYNGVLRIPLSEGIV